MRMSVQADPSDPPMAPVGDHESLQTLVTVFGVSAEQTATIPSLGRLNYVLSTFEDSRVLQVNESPLVITFHCRLHTNVGALLELLPAVRKAITDLRVLLESNPMNDLKEGGS
eukprot:GHVU01075998.1.p1 GENE.GHVU01075998.1~~GHVU01075998.1.p1  ORF type:complete len:113 (+),score=6.84 GHVU01075998.1:550-888(+)